MLNIVLKCFEYTENALLVSLLSILYGINNIYIAFVSKEFVKQYM